MMNRKRTDTFCEVKGAFLSNANGPLFLKCDGLRNVFAMYHLIKLKNDPFIPHIEEGPCCNAQHIHSGYTFILFYYYLT